MLSHNGKRNNAYSHILLERKIHAKNGIMGKKRKLPDCGEVMRYCACGFRAKVGARLFLMESKTPTPQQEQTLENVIDEMKILKIAREAEKDNESSRKKTSFPIEDVESSPASIDSQPVPSTSSAIGGSPGIGQLELARRPTTMDQPWMQEELKRMGCQPGEIPIEVEKLQVLIDKMRAEFLANPVDKVGVYIKRREEEERMAKELRATTGLAEEANYDRPEHLLEEVPFSVTTYADDALITASQVANDEFTEEEKTAIAALMLTMPSHEGRRTEFQRTFHEAELLNSTPETMFAADQARESHMRYIREQELAEAALNKKAGKGKRSSKGN